MSVQYITHDEWILTYGAQYTAGGGVFATSGDITTFLQYISSLIDLYAGQTFVTGSVTQQFTAYPGTKTIFTRRMPLNSVSSIVYYPDGTTDPSTVDSSTYKYWSDGRIRFNDYLYGYAVYEITYNAGYQTIPDAIKQAAAMLANAYAAALDNNGVAVPEGGATTRFVFDKYEENYVDPRQRYDDLNMGLPVTVQAILNRYKLIH